MKTEEVQKLKHGLYKIYWKEKHGGGFSLASVGSTSDGTRWVAPTNWTSSEKKYPKVATTDWRQIKKAKLLHS